ncbi:hypothetical protein QZM52_32995 [Burkholderia metallica]|uniref:Uncharacterized protein n=1 Tax=Burkholderia metallica TaxID=488729 RepID=A0ABT8PLR1_9BURK|nr:hypothetical protein [Burkholderia metallica]MDN7936100.1 hypothetical protein [Burkholderia metallica]
MYRWSQHRRGFPAFDTGRGQMHEPTLRDALAAHSCAASVVDIPTLKSLATLCFSSVSVMQGVDNRDSERRKMLCFRRVSVGDRLRVRLAWCGLPGVERASRGNSGRRAF